MSPRQNRETSAMLSNNVVHEKKLMSDDGGSEGMKAFRTIAVLAIAGIVLMAARYFYYRSSLTDEKTTFWRIDLAVEVPAVRSKQVIRMSPPYETRHVRLVGQNFVHPQSRIKRFRKSREDSREVIAVTKRDGRLYFRGEFYIEFFPVGTDAPSVHRPLAVERRTQYQDIDSSIVLTEPPLSGILNSIERKGDGFGVRATGAFEHVRKRIRVDPTGAKRSPVDVLRYEIATFQDQCRALVLLLRALGIPARMLSGIVLEEGAKKQELHYWVEGYDGSQWMPFDPRGGFRGNLPSNYLPFRKDGGDMVTLDGEPILFDASAFRPLSRPFSKSIGKKRPLDILNLTRLPYSVRASLWILLLLPFGALITIVTNNIFGIRTFGTFTPTLVGLSAVYTDWLTAGVIFTVVAIIGFSGRSMLPGLRLNRKPRLGLVFTLVALSMAGSVSLMHFFNHFTEGYVVLLPIVVLTSFIDKAYKLADKLGSRTALIRTLWTLVIAFLCFLVFRLENLGQWVLRYPEIHFLSMAAIIASQLFSEKTRANGPVQEGGQWDPKD